MESDRIVIYVQRLSCPHCGAGSCKIYGKTVAKFSTSVTRYCFCRVCAAKFIVKEK